jgi:hypothetical protein
MHLTAAFSTGVQVPDDATNPRRTGPTTSNRRSLHRRRELFAPDFPSIVSILQVAET